MRVCVRVATRPVACVRLLGRARVPSKKEQRSPCARDEKKKKRSSELACRSACFSACRLVEKEEEEVVRGRALRVRAP